MAECKLCLYAVDMHDKNKLKSEMFRISCAPFAQEDQEITANDSYLIINNLVQFDAANNVYYYHLGSKQTSATYPNLFFFTPRWLWPKSYTIMLWVQWGKWHNCSALTTFDSMSNTPIFVNRRGNIGCASQSGWKTVPNYRIVHGEWQCVVALGGQSGQYDSGTVFYIGDLSHAPQYIGSVKGDIAGCSTLRIGNANQGPGKVGAMLVYDAHLDMDTVIDLYYTSITEMAAPWSLEKRMLYKQELAAFIQHQGILDFILKYLTK